MVEPSTTYRVFISLDMKEVRVTSFGKKSLDTALERTYTSVKQLPKWMQDQLAVLYILEVADHPQVATIPSVGMRITETVFWVFRENPK